MPNQRPENIAFTATLADGLKQLNVRTGVEHAIFVDHDWTRGPAGRVDLFGCFHTMLGRSVELHESLMFTHCGPMGFYMIPVANVDPFLKVLEAVAFPMHDGSVVIPVCSAPGKHPFEASVPQSTRDVLNGCYVIRPRIYPADHPEVAASRAAAAAYAQRN